ncbi:ribonuclease T2 [Chromobacterium violaceum]|uniref:RNase I n=1 Tax=Chromobacterium violaceum (strain ATCC 12472 / DSM 30191 / JCM 1249 / CCUG 213 / NBRC 12614 / NCIMB 9131 / NCTC 9757 / MK) TaxID=243365 RepID=Q7NZG2_CHRVO|nr:ribonuclease T2 [Chromobacterium violaceum]AAQ58634.1 RNase I precursor [Chromobacterium violaceum ATCC 12472]MBA8734363.1 ribonuclease T2 [Chromobacterium violaceum]SUX39795.1 Ribonuclease I precursor [Chromobacterium violaceum]
MYARIRLVLVVLITALPAMAGNLKAVRNGDFSYYTLTLAWQPGFCKLSQACQAPQNPAAAIALLGLWPSLPVSLQEQGVKDQDWRSKGCLYFSHSVDDPQLSDEVRVNLLKVMPRLIDDDLISSEFIKHAQCFGFQGDEYFSKALKLRHFVVSSPFGAYLEGKKGQVVDQEAVRQAFIHAFGAASSSALSLRCQRDAQQHSLLTSLEIRISAQKISAFPAEASLWGAVKIDVADSCDGQIWIPS